MLELVGDQLVTREVIARRRIKFAEQDRLLADVFRRYHVVRCAMDQTGMGEKPVEDAKARHGEERVDGVLFSASSKLDLATGLKQSLQDRQTLIPAGDPNMRADLHAIKSMTGPTGIRRLVADGDSDGHADRFWALSLAVGASETTYQLYVYRPVTASALSRLQEDQMRLLKLTAGFKTRKGVW